MMSTARSPINVAFPTARDLGRTSLFKFRSYDSEPSKRRTHELLGGVAYFPTLPEFNDPFEGRVRFEVPADPDERLSAAQRYISALAIERGEEETTFDSQIDIVAFSDEIQAKNEERLKTDVRCFCLSGDRKSPLLWSHYADSHRGVCIELRTNWHPWGHALRVDYEPSIPPIQLFDRDHHSLLRRGLLTKAEYWKYEEEFRLLSIRMDNPTWHLDCFWNEQRTMMIFSPSCIASVTLGAKMEVDARRHLIDHLRRTLPSAAIHQARLHPAEFMLTFERVG